MVSVACPQCQSTAVRLSPRRSWKRAVSELVGCFRMRCLACDHRWTFYVGLLDDWRHAQCPRCLNTSLDTWSLKHYTPGLGAGLKLFFGASRVRCERCRHNFAAFRPVREVYTAPTPVNVPATSPERLTASV